MTVYAIDPGPVRSALVCIDANGGVTADTLENMALLSVLEQAACSGGPDRLVIEMIASYGMPVGAEVFETCVWIGRFIQVADGIPLTRIPRIAVKTALCHSARAKDANVRQALIDRYGGPACIKKGGALYQVHGDEWAALAVAVWFLEQAKGV